MMLDTKESIKYTIIHFDDEPANIRAWMSTVFDILCDYYIGLEDVPGAKLIATDGLSMTITVDQRRIQIVYIIACTEEYFFDLLKGVQTPEKCVIIFDLMRSGKTGLELIGDHLFDECRGKNFAGRFFLTAYADRVPPAIVAQIGRNNIWPKPPMTAAFIYEVISKLRLIN